MRALIARYEKAMIGKMSLCVKSPNEHGISFRKIALISYDQARDLVASQTNIVFDGPMPFGTRHVDPGCLHVSKTGNSESEGKSFNLGIMRQSGLEEICLLHEDHLEVLLETDAEINFDESIEENEKNADIMDHESSSENQNIWDPTS